jgi:D-xylose transport system ATP-binding protein
VSDGAPVLALEKVSKSFGPVQALQDVDFEVRPAEVVALVGDNGAGKSTLIKAIAGIHSIDGGRVIFDGEPVKVSTPTDATDLGIATVYQDLALCDNLDVVENLFLGREERAGGIATVTRQLDETSMERQAHELLDNLAVTITDVRSEVGTMSGGQRQQVAIARSLLGEPKVVLLDEPTAALGVRQTAQVLALIKRLRENGHGVVVISHNLSNVFEVADRIVVLRLGRVAAVYDTADTTHEEVVGTITGASDPATGDLGPAVEEAMGAARRDDAEPSGETPDGEPDDREPGRSGS